MSPPQAALLPRRGSCPAAGLPPSSSALYHGTNNLSLLIEFNSVAQQPDLKRHHTVLEGPPNTAIDKATILLYKRVVFGGLQTT